jgi:hypothetical protein
VRGELRAERGQGDGGRREDLRRPGRRRKVGAEHWPLLIFACSLLS